ATALIKILTENRIKVHWWLRDKGSVKHIRRHRHNPKYLSDVQIKKSRVKVYTDLPKALRDAHYVIVAVPAAFVKDALQEVSPNDLRSKVLVSAVKGIIPQDNLLVTQLLEKEYGLPGESLCVIGGPCHAEEVALEKLSYLTISSQSLDQAKSFAQLLNCRYIKTNVSTDVYGVEYSAVMKNIIALACGIVHGLNYGDNFQSVLVSNAMQEIERFVSKVFPHERNMHASVYLGDLLVTAYSQFSRNRTFGNMIGRGYTVQSAQMEMNMIAEGYYAVKSIYEINQKYQVNMPITKAVYNILYKRISPQLEISILRDLLALMGIDFFRYSQ
ncbi:MAG: NAD(P)H-dependent glycerol-3-phosphate dehydrogenase, partial [Bacteroidia bacterium]|nr:NAD(P)H-dependent glycerol-3-phosphate dehydrogenase [Bacteroidia bacterium]